MADYSTTFQSIAACHGPISLKAITLYLPRRDSISRPKNSTFHSQRRETTTYEEHDARARKFSYFFEVDQGDQIGRLFAYWVTDNFG
jgi:hypothetical protein